MLYFIACNDTGCTSGLPKGGHGVMRKATSEGWFLQKDGTAWCPSHTPDWVNPWRESKGYAVNVPCNHLGPRGGKCKTVFTRKVDTCAATPDELHYCCNKH